MDTHLNGVTNHSLQPETRHDQRPDERPHLETEISLGQVVATPGAITALRQSVEMPAKFLNRHVSGDWGDICDGDRQLNDEALQDGSRIMSVYSTSKETKLWIITDATNDIGRREVTTVLLPEDY